MTKSDFQPIADKMNAEGLPALAVETFRHYFQQLRDGHRGYIDRSMIDPTENVPDLEHMDDHSKMGAKSLRHAVVIKLNGGLGTSMGLNKAKSLLPVRDEWTFLDIIARQILNLRDAYDAPLPVLLMNSFNTEADTLEKLGEYPELIAGQHGIPVSFVQNKIPKLQRSNYAPVSWPDDPEKEWCPPGHGDIYTALLATGLLDQLIAMDVHYAFVSNADNLGAVMDLQILGYFAKTGAPFMMEVADRTPMDKKGGHLAHLKDNGYVLRESAQCPKEEMDEFQDIEHHKYFNTNNLWLHLPSLKKKLKANKGILGLPLIVNRKTVDPADRDSTKVYQLESAMGAAISVFPKAEALRVPRSRFVPVKTTQELLALWSDLYLLDDQMNMQANPARTHGPIVIELDKTFYTMIDDFRDRFAFGAPSLVDCKSLRVKGDHQFGSGVKVVGRVKLVNEKNDPIYIRDQTTLSH